MDQHIITRRAEIASILSSLERHRCPIQLHFARSTNVTQAEFFPSLLMGVDREKEWFYLDELSASRAHKALLAGQHFSIRAKDDGVEVFFSSCQVIKQVQLAGGMAYAVSFPSQLAHNQKRDSFRVRLEQTRPISVQLFSSQRGQPLQGCLRDLSNTGCQLVFNQLIEPRFQPLEPFESLIFDLQAFEKQVNLAAEARHAIYDEVKKKTHCGFRFTQVDGVTQAEIDRFVIFLQREQRRLK